MRNTGFIQQRLLVPYWKMIKKSSVALLTVGLTLSISHTAYSDPAQSPLFLSNPVVPLAMLNMTKDHQLYMKLYDDYSDLDGDGSLDLTYKNSYEYYGYFDSKKCYAYSTTNGRFEPSKLVDATTICGGDSWSGNFLNWATMTRMDAVRKILYGGYRSTDTTTTVLERVLLPHDAHSFAKYYNGEDAGKLIPSTVLNGAPLGLAQTLATGITICNTTHAAGGLSQSIDTATNPPLLRIVKGNYELWASNETWQCSWKEERNVSNSNIPNKSGIYANSGAPEKTGTNKVALGDGEYNVRVQVCNGDPDNTSTKGMLEDNCKKYSANYVKPTGLLHKYGEVAADGTPAKIKFGLITGSFSKNKSGGVVRKNISDMTDEINSTTGAFISAGGIVTTLNKLRIRGYSYNSGGYTGSGAGEDNCNFGLTAFANGQCTNWGNPQSEMYLQALRYFAGKTGTDTYDATDNTANTGILNLPKIEPAASANTLKDATKWIDPLSSDNYCAPLNIIQFNASVTSYDHDELSTPFSQLSSDSLDTWTNKIGDSSHEDLYGKKFFVGATKGPTITDAISLCTSKQVDSLTSVTGTCPDAPHLRGTYNIAGLAYFARTNDLRSSLQDKQIVRTYGVELAPAIPSVKVAIPDKPGKFIQILPACANHGTAGNNPEGNCGLVAFKVVSQTNTAGTNSGVLYVNWEAAEQGGDFDQDMWGVIKYSVTSTKVTIKTDVLAQSSGRKLGFGYILSGTETGDGFHVWSGSNGFKFPNKLADNVTIIPGEEGQLSQCENCVDGDAEVEKSYDIGTGSGDSTFLRTPLYYAAKWGGYSRDFETAAQNSAAAESVTYNDSYLTSKIKVRSTSDTYFYATDPKTLQDSLDKTFSSVANDTGSAASVATNSARLSEGNYVYQALFRSGSWDGTVKGYTFDSNGNIDLTSPLESNVPTDRKVYMKGAEGALVDFNWTNFEPHKSFLMKTNESTDDNAKKRLNWILGSNADEYTLSSPTGIFRSRNFSVTENSQTVSKRNVIGDLVNSSPAYVGAFDFRYTKVAGGAFYNSYVGDKKDKAARLFIGGNDGMLHAFDAATLTEKFAYIPTMSFSKLIHLPDTDYGTSSNSHQYLVDGPIITGDAYFKDNDDLTETWHSIVIGTMGAGGKGIFALDVTDVDEPKLMWELTNAQIPDMGFVMGKPFLMPLRNGRWGVILGNGDGGTTSTLTSKLLVIDLLEPLTKTVAISTGTGSGLSAPAILVNAKGEATTVFAGDLKGNLFKFNLNNTSTSSWSSSLMFKAKDSNNNIQPITAAPTVGINDKLDGAYMVYVGTGKYYDTNDNLATSTPKYSFYAIADTGTELSRSDLLEKTYTGTYRTVSTSNPNWTTEKGWYMDFGTNAGERITTKALLIQDKLIFPTLIPTSNACQYGGTSWLMEVPAVGDKFVNDHVLAQNVNNNYLILGNLSYGIVPPGTPSDSNSNNNSNTNTNTNSSASSSSSSNAGPCGSNGSDSLNTGILFSASNALPKKENAKESGCGYKRQSWRQLR